MKIKSVRNTLQPNYPTIELFVKHPELLSRNIPNCWLKNRFVATSLAAFLLYGCGSNNNNKKGESVEIVDSIKDNATTKDITKSAKVSEQNIPTKKDSVSHKKMAVVDIAPIFAYGEGSGATGCIVFSPPVFLSEDEAMKIILNKLKAEGYNFSKENCPAFSFEVEPIANVCDEPKGKATIKLKMDAYNSNSKWAIQFISTDDHDKFKNDECMSSVSSYNLKEASEIINQELKKKRRPTLLCFMILS